MTAIETGRVCIKTRGRNAGKYCIITETIDDNYVTITGPKALNKIKTKKCNIDHLALTGKKLDIKDKATEKDVEEAIESANLTDTFKQGLKL
ncbi:MAG: 50S ribosomal protein L14e [Candidatus Nanohalarchaeota archaeon]|nr:MAG: 50S ribosomal protein L14e [Candidatus Nanohaloarchaeota archaeon]